MAPSAPNISTTPSAGYTAQSDVTARHARAPGRSPLMLGLTVVMIAIVLAGFWPYFGQIAAGKPVERPWVIHLHALVFSGWVVLFATQVLLVYRRRTPTHRMLGRFGMGYGVAVIAMGLVASIVAPIAHLRAGEWKPAEAAGFLILPLGDMVLFGAFFGAAIAYRRKPEVHRRLMLLAIVALVFAPAARAGGENLAAILAIWFLPVILAMANDFRLTRRVHPTYLVGCAVMLIAFSRVFLMQSPGWQRAGMSILHAFGA